MKIKPTKRQGTVVIELGDQDTERLSKFGAVSPIKLQKIMVPIDFSNGSSKAIQYAVPFAKQFNATIVFLHVVPCKYKPGQEADLEAYHPRQEASLRKDAALKLKAFADKWVPPQIPRQIEIALGAETVEIASAAQRLNADLLIISTHGRMGRAHELVGSRAENIVQLASCPVLVVREHEHDFIREETTNPLFYSAT